MSRHFYPAVFHEEDNGYWVEFPGLDGCVTQGATFEEAYDMAMDALGLYLETAEGFRYPEPVSPDPYKIGGNSCIVMVEFDEIEYLKRTDSGSVKKTLTIPKWLDVLAAKHNVNFSQTLRDALIKDIVEG